MMKSTACKLIMPTAVACITLASAIPAFSGTRIWDNTLSTCAVLNCSSLTIPGTVTNPLNTNDLFELQVYVEANECVRLEVTQSLQGVDLEMVVRAPNGSIYRSDDGFGGGIQMNPLVKINGGGQRGWYSVSINQYAGVASYADFVMTYGRYNLGNVNCATPTAPAISTTKINKLNSGQGAEVILVPGVGTVPAQ